MTAEDEVKVARDAFRPVTSKGVRTVRDRERTAQRLAGFQGKEPS